VTIGLEIEGRTAFLDLQISQARLRQQIREDVRLLAREYRAKLIAAIRGSKSGRRYARRSGRKVYRSKRERVQLFGGRTGSLRRITATTVNVGTHRASAPGEAPASFTGTLLRSIRTKFSVRRDSVFARVYADRSTAFYRHMLEFGTANATRRGVKSRLKKGRQTVFVSRLGKGAIAPRPVFSPLQAQLQRELVARVERAAAAFASGR
jgi:hypothetical protein